MAMDKAQAQTAIMGTLTHNPATAQEVADASGVPLSSARKILAELVEGGTVTAVKEGRAMKFALGNGKSKTRKGSRRPDAEERDKRVLGFVKAQGFTGASKYDVAEALDVTPGIAYLSIWRLMKTGDVVMLPTGSRRPVYATPDNVKAKADN